MTKKTDDVLHNMDKPALIRAVRALEASLDEIVVCAVRYALPRHTYITSTMSNFVKGHFDFISNKNLSIIHRDVSSHLKDVEEEKDNIDKPVWKHLLIDIGKELESRGFYLDTSGCWCIKEKEVL